VRSRPPSLILFSLDDDTGSFQTRHWIFGVAALILAWLGWLWFAVCFSARSAAWWNSLYFFAAIYFVAILNAIRGIRSWISILALLFSALSLGCVILFILG
jgi:hypothetical protein